RAGRLRINGLDPDIPDDRRGVRSTISLRLRVAVGVVSLLLLGALAVAFWAWRERTTSATALDEDDDGDQVLAVVNPGYVGIETCAECHAKRAAEFKTTRHYIAC